MKGIALSNILITALVAGIIGAAVVIPTVWQTVRDSTDVTRVVNETTARLFNATNRTSFQLNNTNILINDTSQPFSVYRVRNTADTLTNDVNFTLSKNGTVRINNVSSDWNNTMLNGPTSWQVGVDYSYTGANYLDNSVQRSLIKQLPLIVAMILIVTFAGYIMMVAV